MSVAWEWIVRGRSMKASGDASYALLGAKCVWEQVRALSRQIDGVRNREDIECVHRARVASRRLRTAFALFRNCFSAKKLRRWRGEIRRLTEALGEARDRDVQIEFVRGVLDGTGNDADRPGLARMLLRLEQRRDALQPAVVKALDRLAKSRVLGEIRDACKRMASGGRTHEAPAPGRYVLRQARRRILRRLEELLAYGGCLLDPGDLKRHHEMRIAAKRLRYVMELSKDFYDGRLDEIIRAAKHLQTLLGEIHDCDVWAAELAQFADEERQRTVAYHGDDGPFEPLRVGIDHLLQERRERREETFTELAAAWRSLDERKVWRDLVETVVLNVKRSAEPAQQECEETRSEETGGT